MIRNPAAEAVVRFCFASIIAAGILSLPATSRAQDPQSEQTPAPPDAETGPATDPIPVMFPHPETDRLWISGQANVISQWHPPFRSPYQGRNSLSPEAQDASSRVLTLYTGLRLTGTTELLCDVQETGGHGIGEAFGLAGFTNLDVVRNPALSKAPYIARLMWHQIIPLSHVEANAARTAFSLFSKLPERRLELRFGKFGIADFFDLNNYGSDSNFQFMNWTVDNNGAYDYAADTRGYTFAAMLEYHQRHFSVRFAEALINYFPGLTPPPEITAHPLLSSVKYGFGANFEQPLNDWFGVFGRWGWNEGRHESYAYTEVDSTVELGAGASGQRWRRKFDRAGIAFASNGISRDHQQYLALGGYGFLLGDGRLNYGRETIEEAYYTLHLWRGFYPSVGVQHINNPGYNRDRGPVIVPSLRLHVEF